jgi:HSP20 family protein
MAKRRRTPFGFGLFDEEVERMFEQMMRDMRQGFGGLNFEELEKKAREGKSFVRGYSITVGPEGKPIIREFGDRPKVTGKGIEEREPLVDIIEEKNHIKIVVELPGVSKDKIDLNAKEDSLEINVDTPDRKYYKSIKLPTKIKTMAVKASYKNGVLEVILERREPKREEKGAGHKVKIE